MVPVTFAYFTGVQDWMWVGLIVLVLFGGTKIPQLAKGLGEGIREFKKSVAPDGESDSTPKAEKSDKAE